MIRAEWIDNVREFERALDRLGREVWPRALATSMNKAGRQVYGKLRAYTETAIDKPNAFTKKAWKYVPA
jgi:hypothetical protein